MVFRLTQKLRTKIKADALEPLPLTADPWADWTGRVFSANRIQYILLSNTVSLFSALMLGRGVTQPERFVRLATEAMANSMGAAGFNVDVLARVFFTVRFAKTHSRSVTGSMNDLALMARLDLESGAHGLGEIERRINRMPMSALSTPQTASYATPEAAARAMTG